MGLIGHYQSLRTTHPQELVDLIYEEVFDHHPGDEDSGPEPEVDVIIAFESEEAMEPEGKSVVGITVLDFKVIRVHHDLLLVEDQEDYSGNLIAADQWAFEVEGSDGYYLFHRHPEGYVAASGKDQRVARILSSIDFSRGEEEHRFLGLAVTNRRVTELVPSQAGLMSPVGREHMVIDMKVLHRMGTMLDPSSKAKDDPRFWELQDELAQLISDIENDVVDEASELAYERFKTIGMEQMAIIRSVNPVADSIASIIESLPADMPMELKQQMAEMLTSIEKLGGDINLLPDGSGFHGVIGDASMDDIEQALGLSSGDEEPKPKVDRVLGFSVPEIQYPKDKPEATPEQPTRRPGGIFDLPAIDELDDELPPEARWN